MATRDRILEAAAGRFGIRGVDAVSLDEIAAEVGVRKQTVLYWFASKEELVDGVLEVTAADLAVVIDAAVRAAPDEPLARIDAVVTGGVPPRRAAAGAARPGARAEPPAAGPGDAAAGPRRPARRSGPSPTSAPRWTPAGCAAATPASSPPSPTARSPASPPSRRRCAPSAGRRRRRRCAACAPSCAPSCAPRLAPWDVRQCFGVAAAAAVALERQRDEAVDQLGVADARPPATASGTSRSA